MLKGPGAGKCPEPFSALLASASSDQVAGMGEAIFRKAAFNQNYSGAFPVKNSALSSGMLSGKQNFIYSLLYSLLYTQNLIQKKAGGFVPLFPLYRYTESFSSRGKIKVQ